MWLRVYVVALSMALLLAGCGAVLPIMDLRYSDEDSFAKFVHSIAVHVRCEMHKSVALERQTRDATEKFCSAGRRK